MANTHEQLVASVENIARDLEELVTIAHGGESPVSMAEYLEGFGVDIEDHDGYAAPAAWAALVDYWPLEISVRGSRALNERWNISHVVVVFCTGGPHIELNTRSGEVVGAWGTDAVSRSVSADVTSFYDDVAAEYHEPRGW